MQIKQKIIPVCTRLGLDLFLHKATWRAAKDCQIERRFDSEISWLGNECDDEMCEFREDNVSSFREIYINTAYGT